MKYIKEKLSRGFVSIYSGRIILRIGANLVGIFVPIFLYKLFDFEIRYVILYYLIGHLIYGLVVAWGAQFLNKIGLRRSLQISIVFGALYYVVFYFLEKFSSNHFFLDNKISIFTYLGLALFILTINRVLYWLPLHTDITKFTSKKNRGKQLSLIEATSVFFQAILPLIGGLVLVKLGYNILFIITIIIYLLAIIPFLNIPRTRERFSWSYARAWKEFFSKKRRRTVLAFVGQGAEDAIGMVIWPIFIWELLNGNYFQVGALTSLIVFTTIILQLLVGKFIDKYDKNKIIKYGNFFYAIGWFVKIFIATSFQIFITSTYHNLSKVFARTPFDVLTYERAADEGHYVDEYTVIHEMAINFGKVIMLSLVILLVPFFSIQWSFLLAALASFFMNYLADEALEGRVK